jgi:DNA-3-methyladenine glycosylase
VTRAHDGLALDEAPFRLSRGPGAWPVAASLRIGIAKGVETPWRFGFLRSPYLNRPF